mmetsp:Transcript_103123/g.162979  ORF Transcript_103123/g.162979 Transcript_103123/m.162979 type:complete len:160 (+) Transcript_103123:66-545(+)|eukprot:CAMPEP_0169102006 /NCGR_PEP_ID=MMETSP1015-20121227/21939_1 /TAXON_ID=342587 /ORGANISM="Karlodinium micrum, Strain CCMP2283" /LENGTH=159 /DNA_ID=CAMNT_0009163083 /DNA_START=70 /DNA_END=549 /DNA_ORIENTATION=+
MASITKIIPSLLLAACCIVLSEADRDSVLAGEIKEHVQSGESAEAFDLGFLAADLESRSLFRRRIDPHESAAKVVSVLEKLKTHMQGGDRYFKETQTAVDKWATKIPHEVKKQSEKLATSVNDAIKKLTAEHEKVQTAVSEVVEQAKQTHSSIPSWDDE